MHPNRTMPWLLETDRVTRWYYRDAPAPGSIVMYAHETYIDVVDHVTLTHVWLVSGTALPRPYVGRRLVRWSYTTISKFTSRRHTRSTYVNRATGYMARNRRNEILYLGVRSASTT